MDPLRETLVVLKTVADRRKLDPTRCGTLASPPADDVRAVAGVLGIR